jgi:hypothetical protein
MPMSDRLGGAPLWSPGGHMIAGKDGRGVSELSWQPAFGPQPVRAIIRQSGMGVSVMVRRWMLWIAVVVVVGGCGAGRPAGTGPGWGGPGQVAPEGATPWLGMTGPSPTWAAASAWSRSAAWLCCISR